ncbi:TonB-dependent receptor [Sphingomonas sp. CFBP 8760]|nr:TonB-dependent receptor [Sphingomonas sp. CFBP 8760]
MAAIIDAASAQAQTQTAPQTGTPQSSLGGTTSASPTAGSASTPDQTPSDQAPVDPAGVNQAGVDPAGVDPAGVDQGAGDDIVVTGFRQSLRTAINQKRNADRVQEVLSAEDLGKLPEASIAESLARLPGLATNRDRGNGTQISIRGLGPDLVNTLLNGREVVSAEANRNIRYEQFPAEMLSGASVFKSPTATQVEGAIAGQVDLRSVRPLDLQKGRIAINLRGSYNDVADDIADAKPFGYIGSISYVGQFADDTLGIALGYSGRRQANATVRTNIFRPTNSFADLNGDGQGNDNIPFGFEALVRGGDDIRHGGVAAVQWKPAGGNIEVNGDFFYSHVKFDETQRGVRAEGLPFGNSFANPTLVEGFVTGITATNNNEPFGLDVRNVNEMFRFTDDLYAGGLNAKWSNDGWTITTDAGYSTTHRDQRFVTLRTEYSATANGIPFQERAGINASFLTNPGGVPTYAFNRDLTDPSVNRISEFQIPTNGGGAPLINDELFSLKSDVTREVGGFIANVSAGARFTDRRKDLTQRTQFGFIDAAARVAVPADLIVGTVRFPGAYADLPPTLAIDIPGALQRFFGTIDPQESFFDQSSSWVVKEKTWAGYVQADIDSMVGDMPLTGNIGVRVVRTSERSSSTAIDGQGAVATATPFSVKNSFTDWLPNLNLTLKLNPEMQVRVGASKALARAPLDSLNAGFGVFTSGGTPSATGGNPNLEPFRAKQFDLTWEWYFDRDSALTVSGFYKDLDTYIFNSVTPYVVTDAGGNQITGTFTQPRNGQGGKVKGVEVLFQKALTFLPAPLDGFGVYLNYSYTDSKITVAEADNAIGSLGLPGLSKHVGNATLYYSKSGFEARVAYRYRSAYVTELGDTDRLLYTRPEGVLDFQTSYKFGDTSRLRGVELLLQANNLTDEPFETYYGDKRLQGRYEKFGRRFMAGVGFGF